MDREESNPPLIRRFDVFSTSSWKAHVRLYMEGIDLGVEIIEGQKVTRFTLLSSSAKAKLAKRMENLEVLN